MVRKVSIVLPAFNEAGSIAVILGRIRALEEELGGRELFEVIVVDDGSTDGTAEAAEKAGARVIRHPYNIGNGAAVKSGIRAAGGDIILLMDSDGQHPPEKIPALLAELDMHAMAVGARTRWSSGCARGRGSAALRGHRRN